MRFLLVCLLLIMLYACKPVSHLPSDDAQPALGKGAVLFETIHSIGSDGPHIDRWIGAKVATTQFLPGTEPTLYSLDRVANLNNDSAVFAGVLPPGFYRVAELKGELRGANRMLHYTVPVPEELGSFFVGEGKLTSLGVMMQASVGNWGWVYRRELSFDLPALARHLRPDLTELNAPILVPENMRNKNEPESMIRRAYPTTPLVPEAGSGMLVGAQRGRIYRHPGYAGQAEALAWDSLELNTLQTVVDVLSVNSNLAYALTANGEIFAVDPATADVQRYLAPLAGRAVALGLFNGKLHLVVEQVPPPPAGKEDVEILLQVYRQSANTFDDWQRIGDIHVPRPPHSIVFLNDSVLITASERASANDSELIRMSLVDGLVERHEIPVQMIRHIGDGVLVGADLPARRPTDFNISRDGGGDWDSLDSVLLAGWPALDGNGDIVVPGWPERRPPVTSSLPMMLRWDSTEEEWRDMARYPARCGLFMESGFVDGRLVVFCGERVFQFENSEYGWRKEALHELQSALP